MSFHLAAPSDSSSAASPSPASDSDLDDLDLPFPAPLAADAFSADAPFSPTAFLASLRNRHQTLEDLRAELRTRSKELEHDLVELVNRDYADFVGLGSSVAGGETRVDDVKVGLLAFRREIEAMARLVEGVRAELRRGVEEKRRVRAEKTLARNLLALSMRLDELAALLLLDGSAAPPPLVDDDEPVEKLRKCVASVVYVRRFLLPKLPPDHPFLKAQMTRLDEIVQTICVDLRGVLKEAREKAESGRVLLVLGLFADLGREKEGVRALREGRR